MANVPAPVQDSIVFNPVNYPFSSVRKDADKLNFPVGQGSETLPNGIVHGDGTYQISAYTGAGALAGSYTSADITLDINGRVTAIADGGGGAGGVSQIVAGTNVTISPAGGTGVVTINSGGLTNPLTADLNCGNFRLFNASEISSAGTLLVNAGGEITVNGSKLNVQNTSETLEGNGTGVEAGGYVGNLVELDQFSIFGIGQPNDQEGQTYSVGWQHAPQRWRYIHNWGSDWYGLELISDELVAARFVNGSGNSFNLAMTRTEYTTGVPVVTNVATNTICRLSSSQFGAGTKVRVIGKGFCSDNTATGTLTPFIYTLKVFGTSPGPGYQAIYSEIQVKALNVSGSTDYMMQVMSSGFPGTIGRPGDCWTYDKGIF
jgi:hypothetical protein